MAASIEKARKLRARIFDFALNKFQDEYVAAHKERFGELQAPKKQIPEKAWQDFMEAFIFDRGPEKQSVLDAFRENIKIEDRETKRLADLWDSVQHGMFRSERSEDGSAVAFSLVSETGFPLHESVEQEFPAGRYFVCRLFPLGDETFVPGVSAMPPMSDPAFRNGFLKTSLTFQAMSPQRALASNREKHRKSKEATDRRYRIFSETFGADELTGPRDEVFASFARFSDIYRAKETEPVLCSDMDSGVDLSRFPDGELTMLMHPLTGLSILAGYRAFSDSCRDGVVKEENKDTFVSYAANMMQIPSIWASAIRLHPENTRKALKGIVTDDKIDMFLTIAEQAFIARSVFPPCVAVLDPELVSAVPEFLAEIKAAMSNKKKHAGNVPPQGE